MKAPSGSTGTHPCSSRNVDPLLILTRRSDESILTAVDITDTAQSANGNQFRIGIDTPTKVAVHREEVYQLIQAEKRKPAGAGGATSKDGST